MKKKLRRAEAILHLTLLLICEQLQTLRATEISTQKRKRASHYENTEMLEQTRKSEKKTIQKTVVSINGLKDINRENISRHFQCYDFSEKIHHTSCLKFKIPSNFFHTKAKLSCCKKLIK